MGSWAGQALVDGRVGQGSPAACGRAWQPPVLFQGATRGPTGSSRHGWLNKSTAVLLWWMAPTHPQPGGQEASQLGAHPTIPAAFFPGTQRIAGMGYKGGWAFFSFYGMWKCR